MPLLNRLKERDHLNNPVVLADVAKCDVSAGNKCVCQIDENTAVSSSVILDGAVDIDVGAGTVFNVGTLIFKDGTTLDKLSTGVMQTS